MMPARQDHQKLAPPSKCPNRPVPVPPQPPHRLNIFIKTLLFFLCSHPVLFLFLSGHSNTAYIVGQIKIFDKKRHVLSIEW